MIHTLDEKGFSVIRAAGSGVSAMESPDVIAMRGGKAYAFECKAWNSEHLTIEKDKFISALEWCENAGAEFHVAWKVQNKGWYFVKPGLFSKSPKFYSVSKKKAIAHADNLNAVLGIQTRIPKVTAKAEAAEVVE